MRKRNKERGWYEVVRVVSPLFLVISGHEVRHDQSGGRMSLAPGYYLALGPADGSRFAAGREVRYFGPFATSAVARLLQTSALAFGIVSPAARSPLAAADDEARGRSFAPDVFLNGGMSARPRAPSLSREVRP